MTQHKFYSTPYQGTLHVANLGSRTPWVHMAQHCRDHSRDMHASQTVLLFSVLVVSVESIWIPACAAALDRCLVENRLVWNLLSSWTLNEADGACGTYPGNMERASGG